MNKKKTVLLAAGGTGGHLFPAIALAEELEKSNCNIHLITDLRCKKYLSFNLPISVHIIALHLKTSGILNKIKSLLQLLLTCIKSSFLILKIKPDIVIGFGGYPSFLPMFIAKMLNIPIILQEQNCFLGKSNRFFAKSAKFIALSHKETINIDIDYKSKLVFTGDIIRSSIRNLPKNKNFDSKTFHIFIFGGSQGAKIFSKLIPATIEELQKINSEIKLYITQQVSQEDQNQLASHYKSLDIDHSLSPFFHDIDKIYNNSQLVISRSGAGTIAELTNFGLPAIFIPYPYAMEDHQYYNAKVISDVKAGWSFRQEDISAEILAKKINDLINDRDLLKKASNNLLKRKSNGTKHLANTVLKII